MFRQLHGSGTPRNAPQFFLTNRSSLSQRFSSTSGFTKSATPLSGSPPPRVISSSLASSAPASVMATRTFCGVRPWSFCMHSLWKRLYTSRSRMASR